MFSGPTRVDRSTVFLPTVSEYLTNDFFVNLLDMGIGWQPSDERGFILGHPA